MTTLLRLLAVLTFSLLIFNQAQAYVTKSGNVSSEYWNTDTYYVTGDLTVDAGTTFEIQAGTRVKFAPGTKLTVYGTLVAHGNTVSNIIFTSRDDDSVGEIIAGSDGNPSPGDWETISLNGQSNNEGIGLFDHCILRYGGYSNYGIVDFNYSDSAYVKNSVIENNDSKGINSSNCNLIVENSSVQNNDGVGIYHYFGDLEVNNCQINNNNGYAIHIYSYNILPLINNSGTGNSINAINLAGGTIIQDMELSSAISGFPYVISGQLTSGSGNTLSIAPGEIVKMNGGRLSVYGSFHAEGTEGNEIVFTSLKDDTYGGDLNGDGDATIPAPGDWERFVISSQGSADECFFDHCIIKYGGGDNYGTIWFTSTDSAFIKNSMVAFSESIGVRSSNGDIEVDNCIISDNNGHGLSFTYDSPKINNCQFINNNGYAANLHIVNIQEYTGNSGSGNTINAFGINGNINQDITLSNAANGFPYIFTNDINLSVENTLTIPPGEIIKMNNCELNIYGSLIAEGTEGSEIVFTSIKDDTWGGDLNGDGDVTTPAPGDWEMIHLTGDGSFVGNGFFDYCIVRYGGGNGLGNINVYQSDSCIIKNSIVEFSESMGIRSNGADPLIINTIIQNNNSYGLQVTGSPVPYLGQNYLLNAGLNTFNNNDEGVYHLHNTSTLDIHAYFNDWGYYTEAEIDAHIYDNDENASYGEVLFNPWYDPSNPPFVVHFGADTLSGEAPLAVQFIDSTLFAPNYWEWDFENDGMVDSYDQNPEHWYFDEGNYSVKLKASNGVATDSLIKTDFINITPNQHLRSYALDFDGVDDFVEVPNFNYPEDLTIEAWIRPMNFDTYQEIIYFIGDHSVQFRMNLDGSVVFGEYAWDNWNYVLSGPDLVYLNQWNHIAVSKFGDQVNLYINGVHVGFSQFDNNPLISTLYFGTRSNAMDRYFSGAIDEVRIWSRSLAQMEIQANMTNYYAGTETDLLAYYRLNDVAGQLGYDFTGHGYNAILGSTAVDDVNDPVWLQTNWPYDTYLLADFTADQMYGHAPQDIQFFDFSMNGPETWQWDFENDGNIDSYDKNPLWTYQYPGVYTVRLVVSKGIETDTIIKYDFVYIDDPIPMSIAQARLEPLGSIVTIEGIVTSGNEYGNLHFMQDETAGAGIYEPNITDLKMGDLLLIMGETAEYNGLFELINISYYNRISANNPMPQPQLVSIDDLGEEYEAEVVRINEVDFPYGGNSFFSGTDYDIIDVEGTTHFRMHNNSNLVYQRAPENTVSITGICVNRTDDVGFEYGIYARDYGDLIYTDIVDFEKQANGFTKRYSFLNSISVVDENVVWATANDGKNQFIVNEFTRTTNGGMTWQSGGPPNHDGLQPGSICAVDANNAWVSSFRYWGENPQGIYHTYDGGMTWNHQPTAVFDQTLGGFPNTVYFWDVNNGVCFGDPSGGYFEVYTTTDGGNNWNRVAQSNIPDPIADEYGITDLFSVVDNTIWFPTTKGRIYKSVDMGLNWTVVQSPLNSNCLVEFKNPDDGLLLSQSNGELYETMDGGASWNQVFYSGDIQTSDLKYIPGTPGSYVITGRNGSDAGASYTIDNGQNWFYFPETHGVHFGKTDWVSPTSGFFGANNVDATEGGIWKYTGDAIGLYSVSWMPENPLDNEYITITVEGVTEGAWLHWGVNGWQEPDMAYWPANSELFQGTGPAVQTTMIGPDENHELTIVLSPLNNPAQQISSVDFVIHYFNETWDNNNGNDYHISVSPYIPLRVNVKVFLEGPYNGIDMNTDLNSIIPLQQTLTFIGYDGSEEVPEIPNSDVVDWIGLELRDAADVNSATEESAIGGGAFFLLKDGSIVGLDGSSVPAFDVEITNDLFVVIWHRNHLPVMSQYPLTYSGGIYTYDFTTSAGQAYANNQSDLGGGVYGLIGGNANADETINELDGTDVWVNEVGHTGYLQSDVNMDIQVDNQDKNDIWYHNYGKSEILPSATWNCGSAFTDIRDGQSYNTVQISDQCWMAENLRIGTMVLNTTTMTDNGSIEKYCYGNVETSCNEWGGLYQWQEAMSYSTSGGAQGICPDGWHLPSDNEWCTLEDYLDPTISCTQTGARGVDGGGKLKETGTSHWNGPNSGATNSSGFGAIPNGYKRMTSGNFNFEYQGDYGYWWTSTVRQPYPQAYMRHLYYNSPQVRRDYADWGWGFSVRCVKD